MFSRIKTVDGKDEMSIDNLEIYRYEKNKCEEQF